MTDLANRYEPRRVSPPGATLQDLLDERGMPQNELAERTGLTTKAINEIVKGKAALTPETALKLERALGAPADFWLSREQRYRESLARQRAEAEYEEAVAWLKELPIAELVKRGAIRKRGSKAEQVEECLRFFGVASPEAYRKLYVQPQAAFRRSSAFACHEGATAAWLRLGELQAAAIPTAPFSADVVRRVLEEAVQLTVRAFAEVASQLRQRCADAGVAVLYVPELKGCRASGVTRWLSPSKAILQLSDRYKTEDHLWFTFFHEAGHVLLHQKKAVFLEGGAGTAKEEREADRFAQERLVPSERYERWCRERGGLFRAAEVTAFAESIGVAPGVVVGRLQHDQKIPYVHLNDLKRRVQFPTDQKA